MANGSGGIEHLGYSSVSAHLMCGRCQELRHLEKPKPPIARPLAVGGTFQEAAEAYVLDRGRGNVPSQGLDAEGAGIARGDDSAEDPGKLGVTA